MTNPSDRQLPIEPGVVPVAPGLEDVLESTAESTVGFRAPPEYAAVDRRTIGICAAAVVVAIGAGLAAQLLIRLIGLVTNATFFGRLSTEFSAPRFGTHNPLLIIAIPIGGAIVVGLMARYGSAAIRGHGIPEVMERVLYGESRIPARVLFLKPLSAAIAIEWMAGGGAGATHQGFPVLSDAGTVLGVLTRRDLLDPAADASRTVAQSIRRAPIVVFDDSTLRDAADQMVKEAVGRLPVVGRAAPHRLVGIISRSDLLSAHAPRLDAASRVQPARRFTSRVSSN